MIPTDDDLYNLADEFHGEPVLAVRRALELWGSQPPQPILLAERRPEPKDCDAEGRCWLLAKVEHYWQLINVANSGVTKLTHCFSHWLPAHALPLPEGLASVRKPLTVQPQPLVDAVADAMCDVTGESPELWRNDAAIAVIAVATWLEQQSPDAISTGRGWAKLLRQEVQP